MKYISRKNLVFFFFILIIVESQNTIKAQQVIELKSKYNSLEKFWVATFEGGVTLPFTDFQTPAIGYMARAGVEYYLPSKSLFTFGFRLNGYYGELNGNSNTGRLSGDGTLKRVIYDFNTPFVMLEPSVVLAAGRGLVIPYLSVGLNYFFNFIPLEKNNYSLYTNSKRDPFTTFSGEFGIRYFIHNNFSYNFSVKYVKGNKDEFDGFVSRKKDSFLIASTGISIHLFRKQRIR
ncbi:MAG: hypothetical protein NUV92_07410 [Ignavibacteria bacterium]|jgi:hypothetical protein|nr:hypothetical protein [Ignavibacteria bacterium]MDH7528320.1 hypothetical protein [Ignavibacteria bacterium]